MTKDEVRAQVEAEIALHGQTVVKLTTAEVREIYAGEVAKYGPGRDAFQGTRTEVSAALQLKNPPPHFDASEAVGHLTKEKRDAMHTRNRATVSDKHRILADHARTIDEHHSDAHHFNQKLHATALWREVDRIIAEAGITATSGGAS